MRYLLVRGLGANFDSEAIADAVKMPIVTNTVDEKLPNSISIFDCGRSAPTEGWDDILVVGKCNVGELTKRAHYLTGEDQTQQLIDYFNLPSEAEGEE